MCGGLSVTSCGSLQDLPGYWTHTTNRTRPHAQSTTFREHTCAEIKLHCGRAVPSAPLHAEAEVAMVPIHTTPAHAYTTTGQPTHTK